MSGSSLCMRSSQALSEELGDLDVAECLEVVDGTAVADGKRLAEQRWLVLAVALCGVLFLERASGPADAAGGSGTHVVMVRIEDVDADCTRAKAFGASVVSEPTSFPYGERQYTVDDLAGHR